MSLRFGYVFALGMTAALNPCGFALLPTYLAYFLGIGEDSEDGPRRDPAGDHSGGGAIGKVLGAVGVSIALTLGFVTVFATMGLLWGSLSASVKAALPWVTVVMGVVIAIVGVAMLAGAQPTVRLPKVAVTVEGRRISTMFLYGISYAIASLSCTLPLFVAALTNAGQDGPIAGALTLGTYALGMGALVTLLTVSVALAREGLVAALRGAVRYISRISGGLLVLAGGFVAYYGWWELQVTRGTAPEGDTLADRVTRLQATLSDLVNRVGPTRIGILAASVLMVTLVVALRQRRSATS